MRFSNKAYRYLDKLIRDRNYISKDRTQVESYFRHQGIPVFEKVIDFQIEFSGLAITITNKPGSTFRASLFSAHEIENNSIIEYVQIDDQYLFYCGDHETAQCYFVLNQDGELCTYNNNNNSVNVISSSFDKFIETYAFENLLNANGKYEHPPFYNLTNQHHFNSFIQDYFYHSTANDDFNEWVSKEDTIIHKGTWFDNPGSFIHIYGNSEQQCADYVQSLKEHNVIE